MGVAGLRVHADERLSPRASVLCTDSRDVVTELQRIRPVLVRLVDTKEGCTHRRPAASRETGQKRARPAEATPGRPRVVERGALGLPLVQPAAGDSRSSQQQHEP